MARRAGVTHGREGCGAVEESRNPFAGEPPRADHEYRSEVTRMMCGRALQDSVGDDRAILCGFRSFGGSLCTVQ